MGIRKLLNKKGAVRTALTLTLALAMLLTLTAGLSGCAGSAEEAPGTQLSELFASEDRYSYTIDLVPVLTCPGQDTYTVAQGAASDGTYAYFVMRQSEDGDCIICKYSLKTQKLVKTSEPIHLFHGNDMTYNSKTGLLYVSHGSSEGKILTSVDPETLEPVELTINIEKASGAISYCASRDQYAIGRGGKLLHFFDGELNLLASYDRTDSTGFTSQGVGTDDTYVYFPMSSSGANLIVAYDWDGNYVGEYLINFGMESESMFWVNNTYYMSFNNGGAAHLYRLVITPPES